MLCKNRSQREVRAPPWVAASPVDEGTVTKNEKIRLDEEQGDRFEAILETTWVEEAKREDKEAGAKLLVKGIKAKLAAKKSAFGGL